MRKLSVSQFLTVDGVVQGPGSADEDRDGGFEHGGWSIESWDDGMTKIIGDWIEKGDAMLLGRRTYEIFSAYWPNVKETDPDAFCACTVAI